MWQFNRESYVVKNFYTKTAKLTFIVMMGSVFSGCVVQAPARPGDPYYAPVLGPTTAPEKSADGSLYSYGSSLSLFDDRKAHRIGDLITIVLSERTVSTKSSGVTIKKENQLDFDDGTVLGTTPSIKNLGLSTSLQQNRDFSGESDADQSNTLQGNISVTVADVLPNGNLVVRGEKWMTLNRGEEFIRIAGIVRPDDIDASNSVVSTKLANAHISYSGTGELADAQEMGWLTRFFNSPIWPF